MSSKPTLSQENRFRQFNQSATSQERKLHPAEGNVTATSNCNTTLLDSFRLPSLPSQSSSVDSVMPQASPAADCFSATNAWNMTSFLSAAGTSGPTMSMGALPGLPYSGLAGTNSRSVLGMSSPWPATDRFKQLLEQSRRSNFSKDERGLYSSKLIPFKATSRELAFKMDALDRLQKAIDLIPMIDKIDFLAALQVAPELVSKESDYFRFLRHSHFDAKAAADKLVSYWRYRRSLFGDRAFRPMVMTGDGALSPADIELIKSGFIAHAPKDSEGCPVVILDASRRNTDAEQVRLRATFYHAQCLSEDSITQTQGYVILCMVSVYRYDRTAMEAVYMVVNTFPMKVKAWHTLDCIKDRNSLEQGFLLGFMEVFLNPMNKVTTYLYSADAMEDIVWELATEHGLSIESIPFYVGGSWTYDVFEQWLVERMRLENNHYFQGPTHSTMTSDSRRIHASPRPHKRSKWGEEDKSKGADSDEKPSAGKAVDTYDGECIEGLLTQFQKLLLHTNKNHENNAGRLTTTKPETMSQSLHGRLSQHPLQFYSDEYAGLEKAMQAISVHDKVDYLTALLVAPELVMQESNPSYFLSFHGYDADMAAQGIVRYWKERRVIFGERAFLPMTLSGTGALNTEDIKFHQCGNFAITGQDQQGSTVLVLDPSRRTTDDRGIRVRVCFYIWQVLCDNPVNRESGFIGIHIIRAPIYDKVVIEGMPMVLSLFPIKLKALHTYDLMTKIDLFRRGFVQGLSGIIWSAYTATSTFFHSPHRAEEALYNLETHHGLPRTAIPICIGGTWNYDHLGEFWKERIALERKRYLSVSNCATTSTTSLSHKHLAHGTVAGSRSFVLEDVVTSDCNNVHDVEVPPSIPQRVHQEEIASSDREINYSLLLHDEARRLPAGETVAYFEAVKNAPQKIWDEECCPELFLRVEEFDSRKAATRLAKYWQWRSLIFGPNQYASLTQTGDDALGRRELSTLGTGFLNLLPNDIHGRSVLYIDPSLSRYDLFHVARQRCIFYMMSLMTENNKSLSDGAVLIIRVYSEHFGLDHAPLLDALSKALPLKITSIHLISQEIVPTDVLKSLECMNVMIHKHVDPSKDVLRCRLESFGLTKAGLPKFLNGEWGVEKFLQWQELRTRIEWKIPTCLAGRDYSLTSNFPAMKSYSLLSDDEETERKRRMGLIHFRRKQNRIRVALVTLQETCSDLQQENNRLLQENEELEAQYAKAKVIVSGLQSDE